MQEHRRQWQCQSCPNKLFETSQALGYHLQHIHSLGNVDDAILQASSRPLTEVPISSCLLCDDWELKLKEEAASQGIPDTNRLTATLGDFRRHLGHHLTQLALFCIPPEMDRSADDESQDDSDNDDGSGGVEAWNEQVSSHSDDIRFHLGPELRCLTLKSTC